MTLKGALPKGGMLLKWKNIMFKLKGSIAPVASNINYSSEWHYIGNSIYVVTEKGLKPIILPFV